jgi:hypothetical protein
MPATRSSTHATARPAARSGLATLRVLIMLALLLGSALLLQTQIAYAQLPTLSTFPTGGPAGMQIVLRGGSYPPGATAFIFWDGTQTGQFTIGPNGEFAEPFEVPRAALEGEHQVAVCTTSPCSTPSGQAFTNFTVTQSGRIRVCLGSASNCTPANTATVRRMGDQASFSLDTNGYIVDRQQIAPGDMLWALHPHAATETYTHYYTNGDPEPVTDEKFIVNGDPPGVMTILVRPEEPLMAFDLNVSAQWNLSTAERAALRRRIVAASDHLYDFTDGQALFRNVEVRMDYEGWNDAHVWLYADNNLRPKATAGGIVDTPQKDPGNADVTYYPGHIHIGNYWNRYNRPPGEPIVVNGRLIQPATYAGDYALAFAHENGHYLFFLFDTYFGVNTDASVFQLDTCVGSAMGWVYEPENWGFVYDDAAWATNCAQTHANSLLGRTEWATIRLHYPWLVAPSSFVVGPTAPPVPMTNVQFIAPANPSTPLANQTFDLLYENGETASRRAKGYIYRNERIIAQGNAPKGTTSIVLTGAQAGDTFCLYDIDANPPAPNTPRHQYGCERLEVGDNVLDLERNVTWAPIVLLDPIGERRLQITVRQPMGAVTLSAYLFREHEQGVISTELQANGDTHTGVFNLPESTPSAFVRVIANENATETNPRRDALAMYGVGGGTVPGPSSWTEKAPVYSPDGEAAAWPIEAVQLQDGHWVSIQYMVATYDPPPNSTQLSDAYRVISWPQSLAQSIVAVVYTNESELPNSESIEATSANVPAIHYWDGSAWQRVETTYPRQPDGTIAASAIVPANAIFALFDSPPLTPIYLPLAARNQ